jgi:hypothetical protein
VNPLRWVTVPREVDMRVPDVMVLKSVAIVCEAMSQDFLDETIDELGTGFVVAIRSEVAHGYNFLYFVTAKHVLKDHLLMEPTEPGSYASKARHGKRPIVLMVNNKDGNRKRLEMIRDTWYFHPSDPTADVAIHPIEWISIEHDFIPIHSSLLVAKEGMRQLDIGIGDDIYMPGLFASIEGLPNVHPILRHGTIAMLPTKQIQLGADFVDVYLMEARSISGISGSPVFVRPTVSIKQCKKSLWLDGLARFHRVLGMAWRHWDIPPADINSYHPRSVKKDGVNMGIAVITPAYKILETIERSELKRDREVFDAALVRNLPPTLDRRLLDEDEGVIMK